jgi:4-hydroxy-tetrahydrodipicolinate reductase
MGGRITTLASQTDDIEIVGGLDRPEHLFMGGDLGEAFHVGSLGARIWPANGIEEAISKTSPGVLVDFTNAEASTENVVRAAEAGVAVVMGTTGHDREQMMAIRSGIESAGVPAVLAPNMSVGVNVLFEACDLVAKMLPGFDVEVFEIHHNQKVDAPSGTALKLAERLAESLGRDPDSSIVTGRSGTGRREKGEIGVASLRAGDVVGDHTVVFAGIGERIELVHRTQSRDALASGALTAIRFVADAPPGIYSMKDVLVALTGG